MRKIWLLAITILATATIATAQGSKDYDNWDFYGGYSLGRFTSNIRQATFNSGGGAQTFADLCSVATGEMLGPNSQEFFCTRRNFNGFEGSVARNFSRHVGVVGDFTAHFKKTHYLDNFTPPGANQTLDNEERYYQFLGGMQFKLKPRSARLKPFAQVLAGFARYTNRQSQTIDIFPQFNFALQDRVTSFAMKVGGGVDIRAGKRIDIRVIEADYNPVFAKDRNPERISGPFTASFVGRNMNGLTIGAGIVIH